MWKPFENYLKWIHIPPPNLDLLGLNRALPSTLKATKRDKICTKNHINVVTKSNYMQPICVEEDRFIVKHQNILSIPK